jgi:pimeloyl-ACP methyl ester carboxylesterase
MGALRTLAGSRTGTGEPLLLLHGIGTTRDDFAQVIPLLETEFDVLAIDLPGQGASPPLPERPTVAALADALERDLDARGLGTVHILGNSLGARLALELARRGRASSVVAIAPSGLGLPFERVFQMAGVALAGAIFSTVWAPTKGRDGRHPPRIALVGLRVRPWRAARVETDALVAGFGSPHLWSLLGWALGADVVRGLEVITCPVTLAQGSADFVNGGQTVRFLPLVPTARFALLPCSGHAAQGDAPQRVAQLVRATAARAS